MTRRRTIYKHFTYHPKYLSEWTILRTFQVHVHIFENIKISIYVLMHTVLCLVVQSCPTLCNPTDCSPPGFSVHWHWSGLPWPLPEDTPKAGIKPRSLTLQAISYHMSHQGSPYLCTHSTYYTSFCLWHYDSL